jgi:hypothetical protein
MTQTTDTFRRGRPSGARRPGAVRTATRHTRVRVSSDAVVSAYIHDIARPPVGGEHQCQSAVTTPGRPRLVASGQRWFTRAVE